jgi:hypothetical protein
MLNYLLSILGLAALTACWVLFQLWLKKQDPDRGEGCVGCSRGCESGNDGAPRPSDKTDAGGD